MANYQKVTTWLWYDHTAEEAANFYVSLIPGSEIIAVTRSPADYPDGKQGAVITVEFSLAGTRFGGLNGGPAFKHTEAASIMIITDDQAETDRLWNAIINNGGKASACGWCSDKWGVPWQITPRRLMELMQDKDRDRARRAMQSMMTMGKIDIAELERAAK